MLTADWHEHRLFLHTALQDNPRQYVSAEVPWQSSSPRQDSDITRSGDITSILVVHNEITGLVDSQGSWQTPHV